MNATMLIEQLLANNAPVDVLSEPLPDDVAAVVVERLKEEADRHWGINANHSLRLAELIKKIGQVRGDIRQIALGTMARGDALKLIGHIPEAWDELERAGSLFLDVGDKVGWARTRIGQLAICVDLGYVDIGLTNAEQAYNIFTEHKILDKRLVLALNIAAVHHYLGKHEQALERFKAALVMAEEQADVGEKWLGPLYTNIGFTYEVLGDLKQALAYHEHARTIFINRNETSALAIAELNIAHVFIAQGQYRPALHLLHAAYSSKANEKLWLDAAHIGRDIIECNLLLNRYIEARQLAREVSEQFQALGATREAAITLLHLATAEAELGEYQEAQALLRSAEKIFTSLGADSWVATIRLRQGRIALQQGDIEQAQTESVSAVTFFNASNQQVDYATAKLLQGQTALASGDLDFASEAAGTALRIAKVCNLPSLRYNVHLLLGRIAEAKGDLRRAAQRYRAAASTVDRVQRGLTITLRPGFLEDKEDALRSLLALQLQQGQGQQAFETLERAKSQTLLNYLTNRQQFHWTSDDPRIRALTTELDQLRAEHQWFYHLAYGFGAGDDENRPTIEPSQARVEVAQRERRMGAITEQLYIASGENSTTRRVSTPSVKIVQQALTRDTLLVEYYNDGTHLWAFTVDQLTLEVHALSTSVAAIEQLLAQLQINNSAALTARPDVLTTRKLTNLGQRILRRLYAALIEPLVSRMEGKRRLLIVPYGVLHYMPFQLLYNDEQYLIDQYEVVVLPTASLVTQQGPQRTGGARVLAHTWDNRLPQTRVEAEDVHRIFGGEIWYEKDARRSALQAEPTQILHIAAHGEHRPDNPDLSFIQLSDGQLYTDDLLQHDLSYELVVLSACETGRVNVAPGDELIGLGRGFLYAGAGALIVSMWRVDDEIVVELMSALYDALRQGLSKAVALCHAQRKVRDTHPHIHPAFWGAFQLIGDASPLSVQQELAIGEDFLHEKYEITAR